MSIPPLHSPPLAGGDEEEGKTIKGQNIYYSITPTLILPRQGGGDYRVFGWALIIAFFLVAPACKSPRSVSPSKSKITKGSCLQLMTYNIRVGAGRDGLLTPVKYLTSSTSKLRKIGQAIRSVDPDIVALQEVRGAAQAQFLADLVSMDYVYMSHEDSRLEWGLALLSSVKITEYHKKFIRYDKTKPRIALICTVEINDLPVTIIDVHFYLGDYDEQVEETAKLMGEVVGPVILMGDLNLIDPDDELTSIKKRLVDTCEVVNSEFSKEAKEIGTHRFGSRRLDYIFVDPNYFSVVEAGLLPEKHRHASDHLGYFACVKLKRKDKVIQERKLQIHNEKVELSPPLGE